MGLQRTSFAEASYKITKQSGTTINLVDANTSSNLNVSDVISDPDFTDSVTTEVASQIANQTVSDELSLGFIPQYVNHVAITNQEDVSAISGINNGEYAVLIGQDTASENGLYLKTAGVSSKQSLIAGHNYAFIDISSSGTKEAIYNADKDTFSRSYYETIDINYRFSSTDTTPEDMFKIVTIYDKTSTYDLDVIGVKDTATNNFHGKYTFTFFNDAGTYRNFGNFSRALKTNGTFTAPTLSVESGTPPILRLTPGETANVDWFIKGTLRV